MKNRKRTPDAQTPPGDLDAEAEGSLKRYRFRMEQTVFSWGEVTVDAASEEEAEELSYDAFEPSWPNTETTEFVSELLSVEPIPVPTREAHHDVSNEVGEAEADMAGSSGMLCSVDMGRFSSVVHASWNDAAETYTYTGELLCDGKAVLAPLQKHELAGVSRIVGDRGLSWLGDLVQGQDLPAPTTLDLQMFHEVVQGTHSLIGTFVERGHEVVLRDAVLPVTRVSDVLGSQVEPNPSREHGHER
jgi:hypothetical protein